VKTLKGLVLTTSSNLFHWGEDFAKFGRIKRPIFVVRKRGDLKKLAQLPAETVVIASWSMLARNALAFQEHSYEVVVGDEAQALRNPFSKTTEAFYGKHCTNSGVAAKARRVFVISGTLFSNSAAETYSHVRANFPLEVPGGHLPFHDYGPVYAYPRQTAKGHVFYVGARNEEPLVKAFGSRSLGRTLDDVGIELPPIRYTTYELSASAIPEKAIRDLEQHEAFKNLSRVLSDAEASQFLDQPLINGPLMELNRLTESAKAVPTAELVAEELAESDKKFLIFTRFLAPSDILMEKLAEFSPLRIVGGQSSDERARVIKTFQENPKHRVMVASIQAANAGITLTAATDVMFLSADWDPAINDQAAKRAHRIGQTRPVLVRFVALAGSIDVAIQRALARKTEQLANLLKTPTHTDLKAVA
jgi:SWI/SNF-related matrix-associated actin-dependent regulator 1 of chromatin subfamily A